MIDRDFNKWKVEHATLFRFADEDMRMIDLWRASFESREFTSAELSEASRTLAEGKQAKLWRTEHLDYLLTHVSTVRLIEQQRLQAIEDLEAEKLRCQICGGSGLLIVPHPGSYKGEAWEWPYYDSVIACDCPKGIRLFNRQAGRREAWQDDKKKKMSEPNHLWSIQQYESRFPFWRIAVEQREYSRNAIKEARSRVRHEDRRRGPLGQAMAKVAAKVVIDTPKVSLEAPKLFVPVDEPEPADTMPDGAVPMEETCPW